MIKTHASLFSGIGGAELAATWMGWDNVFHCEINPFGRRVLDYWYPNSISYEDITKTDFSVWRGKIRILTGGFPCFVAGTPVLTDKGFMPIEAIGKNCKVLSTDGQYHDVECLMVHNADEILAIRAQGMFEPLKCTPNHPFYVRRKRAHYKHKRRIVTYDEPQYLPAAEIKIGDKIGYPVHEGSDHSYTPAFWNLVGAWIADGWCDNSIRKGRKESRLNKTMICCGKNHITRLHHIIQRAGFHYTMSEDWSTFRCIIVNKWLCGFLQDFGKYAHGKHLSSQCFKLDNERKRALLEGWFADGYTAANGSIKITTVSRQLAMDMAQIARDVYKCPVSISKKTCNRVCIIEGRTVNERPQYCVTILNNTRYGFYADGLVWCNVKSIERKKENNQVFNLSVYEEHSYTVYGIAVHNCQPFSVAGARKGADDDRYLWPEMLRAIREIQPAWVVGENVNGIVSMVQPGGEAEVGRTDDIFEENHIYRKEREYVVETVCKDLEREGYSVQPIVIPACAVGAPHRRDRVWFVAHANRSGLQGARTEQLTAGFAGGSQEVAADTDVNGDTAQKACERTERGRRRDISQQGEWRDEAKRPAGLHGLSRDAADTDGIGLQERVSEGQERRNIEDIRIEAPDVKGYWDKFPTQPPVCGGNDGLPRKLAGISFPKWRAEAVKALGNAWMPQVAYEIFKAIEKVESESDETEETAV